jgi:hypothetical protein
MKKLLFITLILLCQINFAQESKTLGDFDTVKVFDKLSVKLIPGTENKIEISGLRASEVELITKNNELKIRMPFPKLLTGEAIIIKLYFKKIVSIYANEGSSVSCDAIFKQTTVDLNAKEGAAIDVVLDIEKANIKTFSGGIITISGKSTNQSISINSGGILNAIDLITSQSSVSVAAGGSAEIFATTLVEAKVRAGGSIFIHGKPKQINQETILGGTILEK